MACRKPPLRPVPGDSLRQIPCPTVRRYRQDGLVRRDCRRENNPAIATRSRSSFRGTEERGRGRLQLRGCGRAIRQDRTRYRHTSNTQAEGECCQGNQRGWCGCWSSEAPGRRCQALGKLRFHSPTTPFLPVAVNIERRWLKALLQRSFLGHRRRTLNRWLNWILDTHRRNHAARRRCIGRDVARSRGPVLLERRETEPHYQ